MAFDFKVHGDYVLIQILDKKRVDKKTGRHGVIEVVTIDPKGEVKPKDPPTIVLEYPDNQILAMVLETGPGRLLRDGSRAPMSVKRGDMILMLHQPTVYFVHENNQYFVIHESDAVLTYDKK